ncbi:AAA family ATPase [uncultured Lutibacter sp.]|uniref:ATP-dependent nuclease n=1 Tax=uncultured Lutibacter sp. TaxID=437739 RepID=UPI002604C5EF|nr:AAA family ATPase [uncultured Lutibacter sp.]
MKIKSINIKNFRSIKNITIPIETYGDGSKKSNTLFLVGMNESGKSAILEAISLISKGMSAIDYEDYCFLEAQEDNGYIDLYTNLELTHIPFWRKQITEKIGVSEDFSNKIEFLKLQKNTYINSEGSNENYSITINSDLPFYQYIINTSSVTVANKTTKKETIELLKDYNEIEEEITEKNAKSFLSENQKLLTKSILENKISSSLKTVLNHNLPKIQIWRSSSKYLINDVIDLEKFKEDTDISIPLKNIFNIYGKTKDEDIKYTIERALSNQARRDELQEKMTDKITRHINRIWKEHKIKIRISINASKCQVQIEDKDKKFAYYTMNQRSDGFKQFVSLILSLSAQNESNNLKNRIILIDEPEVHLHPSGVRYMRDEILKIGKNNNVLVSTHSHYMIDTETPERHWLVKKEKSETRISQISQDANIEDDTVLTSAFGLNLFKELLPKNIIIVEGNDDKNIISHSLNILKNKLFYSIKSAGGASKTPGFARLLNEEKISAFILLDSDKEGRDNKKLILKNQSDSYSGSNLFTLKDLLSELPNDSTIEDLLPLEFVKNYFDKEMDESFNLEVNKPIIHQLKNQSHILKTNKQKLDSLKFKLSEKFCLDFKSKAKIEDCSRLKDLIEKLYLKIDSFEQNAQ